MTGLLWYGTALPQDATSALLWYCGQVQHLHLSGIDGALAGMAYCQLSGQGASLGRRSLRVYA